MRGYASTLFCALTALLVCAGELAFAQSPPLAPIGNHYAGRSSDTGFSAVTNMGGYGANVPLDLPAARGGATIPLQLVYGGRRVGIAGVGWDVPLSFVSKDQTINHRRPRYQLGAPFEGRELITVSVAGETMVMMPSGRIDVSGRPIWVARENALGVELVNESESNLLTGDPREAAVMGLRRLAMGAAVVNPWG